MCWRGNDRAEQAEGQSEQQIEVAPMIGVDLEALDDDQDKRRRDGDGMLAPW
jgi:hypothetical protein